MFQRLSSLNGVISCVQSTPTKTNHLSAQENSIAPSKNKDGFAK